MKTKVVCILFLQVLISMITSAHPGTGIVVDKTGHIYFTDTGKGIWKIGNKGKLTYLPASKFHWLTIDESGMFSNSPKNFGEYFERVTPQRSQQALVICSDFPVAAGRDGNIYYANTRPGVAKIIRRTVAGQETIIAANKIFQYVSDLTAAPDGSLYITEASDRNANTIRKVTMDGNITVIATYRGKNIKDMPLETTPSYLRGLSVDAAGNVYVAATGSRCVLKISPQGVISNILREPSPWSPTGIAIYQGEIFVLEWHDVSEANLEVRIAYIPRVRKIGRDGKATTLATVSR